MVKASRAFLKDACTIISKTLSEILVCPLSKQPLRVCEESNSLISDALGVSYPIVDGIPCLVPKDGKLLETGDLSAPDDVADSSVSNNEDGYRGGNPK
ncbi:UPF0434 protein Aave_2563 [Macadamia integrifolia]|uniref:UPF0434 protein Aave_2563 n=1 Tax=Macadamia integrifolia TaxID=60698 RepID=UPI001C4E6672|nr:UPF0434 protein Aave_2563 [Macadamia integrifolia]XP_042507338.1 UPF0434 protein Aave_2563 [Macadamia integrifolia]